MRAPRWLVRSAEVFGVVAFFGSLLVLWMLSD